MNPHRKKLIIWTFLIVSIGALVTWDMTTANKMSVVQGVFCPESEINAISSATTKVAVITSDDQELPNPTSTTDAEISYEQIKEMLKRALALQGGTHWLILPGDKVLIKPNIVDPEPPGSGEVTDVRVVKALIDLIDEQTNGNVEILIGEGSPREMDYELVYSSRSEPFWEELWDVAGYQDLLADPDLNGINFRLVNLNGSPPENPWQDLVLVDVPNGGVAAPQGGQYWVHREILDADVYITVPVLKTHKVGVTAALKNQIGIAPSTKYGFSKTGGVPQENYAYRLIHRADLPRDWVDEEIVDLSTIAEIDLCVVDALVTLEEGKVAIRDNEGNITNQVRFNTIIAGVDPVAVDNVCARLIGLNPDDINHITLAEKIGLGTNNPDNIEITGANLADIQKSLKKDPYFTSDYGQSNRTWLISQLFETTSIDDPINFSFIADEQNLEPVAQQNNWSEAMYFFDDRIALDSYFGGPSSGASYCFSYFSAPQSQEAELWIGSDEALKVYINHQLVYTYTGTRSYREERLVSEVVPIQIEKGENTLLVKSIQNFGEYDFALNICEPDNDPDTDGNRVDGLKFYTQTTNPPKISLSIGDTSAVPTQTVNVPFKILDIENGPLNQCLFTLSYNNEILTPAGTNQNGTLSENNGTINTEQVTAQEIRVTYNCAVPIEQTGTLFYLQFTVSASEQDQTDLTITSCTANNENMKTTVDNGIVTIDQAQNLNVAFGAGNTSILAAGSKDNMIASFTLKTNFGSTIFNSIYLEKRGNCALDDIDMMAICRDNGDGAFDPNEDERISNNKFYAQGTKLRLGDTVQIDTAGATFYIIADVVDVISSEGATFGIAVNDISDFTFADPIQVVCDVLPFESLETALPVEMVFFEANVQNQFVSLNWMTRTETDNYAFDIEKSYDNKEFVKIGTMAGNGTSTTEKNYQFVDENQTIGTVYYRLKQTDFSGNYNYSGTVCVEIAAPKEFRLAQNYPNPFNPTTNISFSIAEHSLVNFSIYSINGVLVRELINGQMQPGQHTVKWNAVDNNGNLLPSGIYFGSLKTATNQQVIKMSLIH